MHYMTTGEADAISFMCDRETHHRTQVVKMLYCRDLLIDCCMSVINESTEVHQLLNNHNSNLTLVIQLNSLTLKQNESLSNDHYLFYPVD